MKLRIRGNTIRFRLLKSDVSELSTNGFVSETTDFGDSLLTYGIRTGSSPACATFKDGSIIVTIPDAEVREWAATEDKIGIETESNGLKLLIEKDFACPTRTDDPDNLDAFADPEAVCT